MSKKRVWIKGKCTLCGLKRNAEGHDPCIANLPGVDNACCGHGVTEAYVSFKNGMVIRGEFDREEDGSIDVSSVVGNSPMMKDW